MGQKWDTFGLLVGPLDHQTGAEQYPFVYEVLAFRTPYSVSECARPTPDGSGYAP